VDSWLDKEDLEPPVAIEQAVIRLIGVLSIEEKMEVKMLQEEDLMDLHFGLGASIRNVFRLHDLNSPLLKSCGELHPDDASVVIIKALWTKLNNINSF
jgi:hypothetical protein